MQHHRVYNDGRKRLLIRCPPGAGPGTELSVQTPEGTLLQLRVPPGAYPGKHFEVLYHPGATPVEIIEQEQPAVAPAPAQAVPLSQGLPMAQPAVPTLQGVPMAQAVAEPSLSASVDILRRELGVSGNMSEVVNTAADMLGVDPKGRSLPEIAMLCVTALGVAK